MQPDNEPDDQPTVIFHKVYPAAISPMRADKAALGTLPTMAYRHCEPVRTASAFGWYIFPPEDIYFKWNGSDILFLDNYQESDEMNGQWKPLEQIQLPNFSDYWDTHAPSHMQGMAPPFMTPFAVSGFLQIWSGLLCSTQPGWSLLVRPVVNIRSSHNFNCFEGLVESDQYKPFPLFINMQLLATDVVIKISKTTPLFQIQPLKRETYGDKAHRHEIREGLELAHDGKPSMSDANWAGFRKTIRVDAPGESIEKAEYTNATRKRTKHESDSE